MTQIPFESDSVISGLLRTGLRDELSLADAVDAARTLGCTNHADTLSVALGVVAFLLFENLAEAGDVIGDLEAVAFIPWGDGPGESLARIAKGLLRLSDFNILPGDIAWLSLTKSGAAVAKAL